MTDFWKSIFVIWNRSFQDNGLGYEATDSLWYKKIIFQNYCLYVKTVHHFIWFWLSFSFSMSMEIPMRMLLKYWRKEIGLLSPALFWKRPSTWEKRDVLFVLVFLVASYSLSSWLGVNKSGELKRGYVVIGILITKPQPSNRTQKLRVYSLRGKFSYSSKTWSPWMTELYVPG